MQPDFGTRPKVGLCPLIPQNAAGQRMLPPVSVPSPPWNSPAATPLPVPELEPPGQVSVSQGLRGTGKGLEASGMPQANSIVLVLPRMTLPAARSRFTTGASPWLPHAGSRIRLWAVVGPSSVAMMSLMPRGTPCRAPRSTPAASSASRAAAAARAASSKRTR